MLGQFKSGKIAASLIAVGVLAGCASQDEVSPDKNAAFGSVEEVKGAATEAGLDCPSWEPKEQNGLDSGHLYMTCSNGDRGVIWYREEYKRDQYVTDMREKFREFPSERFEALVGANWVVVTDDAADLQEALGGDLLSELTAVSDK